MEDHLKSLTPPKQIEGRDAVYYQRRGFITGTGTLIDDILAQTGLINFASRAKKSGVTQIALEELIVTQPDYLIFNLALEKPIDLGTELLQHPALRRHFKPEQQLYLPQSLTVCGGPSFPHAVEFLIEQLRSVAEE